MEFLVCKCGPYVGLQVHVALQDIEDTEEAICRAREIALHAKERATVGLFTREGEAICGWKVGEGGKLERQEAELIENVCAVGEGSFEAAKRDAERRARAKRDE